jgi:dinuclear metal center YbgI/SA1388 family protein
MVSRNELTAFLDEVFQVSVTADGSYNGLQFEGKETVRSLVTGVDAVVPFFERAVARKADFALVHHGLFWKNQEWRRIDRFQRRLLTPLHEADLNLYAVHLPLDAHPEWGNNACLARALGAKVEEPFAEYLKLKIGFIASLPRPISLEALQKLVGERIGPVQATLPFGPARIKRIGIVSGGGWDAVNDPAVAAGGVDAIITGEILHQGVPLYRERGVHLIAAGHYATETFGVRAIGDELARRFKLRHTFIDVPTGL